MAEVVASVEALLIHGGVEANVVIAALCKMQDHGKGMLVQFYVRIDLYFLVLQRKNVASEKEGGVELKF